MTGLSPPPSPSDAPSGPPMYPPGWYPDPVTRRAWRWWDGGRWTQLTAPFEAPKRTRSGLPTVSQWFDETVRGVRAVARELWWRLGVVWLLVALWAGGLGVAVATSDDGRTIRDALGLDGGVFSRSSAESVTDDDLERAGDALIDLAVSFAPWAIASVVVIVLVSSWTYGAVAAVVRRHGSVDGARAVRAGLRRTVPVAASWIVLYAVVMSVSVLLAAPALMAWIVGADGTSVAILALFGLLAALVVLPMLGGRLALAPALASLGGRGVGVTASWDATSGRFWAVVGRLLLAALFAGAVAGALSSLLGVLQFVDLVTYLAVAATFQAVAALVQTAVLVPGQIVLVDQIADLDGGDEATAGSSDAAVGPTSPAAANAN